MVVEAELLSDRRAGEALRVEPNCRLRLRRAHTARCLDSAIGKVFRRGSTGDPKLPSHLLDVAYEPIPIDKLVDLGRAQLTGQAPLGSFGYAFARLRCRPEDERLR